MLFGLRPVTAVLWPFLDGGEFFRVDESLLEAVGDLARFADSRNQCLREANWLRKA